MPNRYRFALRPQWWGLHLFTIAMIVTMTLLGRWQLTVSEAKHFNIRNFGYALQWWAFSLFTLIMWARILRDQARHGERSDDEYDEVVAPSPAAKDVPYRRYVPPAAPPVEDDVIAEYNDYLARLHGKRSAT